LLDYSERLLRAELHSLPGGAYSAEDFLDDDGCGSPQVRFAVKLQIDPIAGNISMDFTGSSPQIQGSLNAVRAITLSACFYVLRCLLPDSAPATAGILRPLQLITQPNSVVDAPPPAAVAGGNVETSQRIVDTILLALSNAAATRTPAASAGTMSNLTIGGVDHRTQLPFTYYETTAGGAGARPTADGISGVQTHMTNSLNTPIEALEFAYPVRMIRYAYRHHSGGAGLFRGGDGLIRELQLLTDANVTLLADRRDRGPYGLSGGHAGSVGSATATLPGELPTALPGKSSQHLSAGTILRIETPGGGGWGNPDRSASDQSRS
jgi:N-methylhydantoinase B